MDDKSDLFTVAFETTPIESIETDQGIVSISQFSQVEKITWTESPIISQSVKKTLLNNKEKFEEMAAEGLIQESLKHPHFRYASREYVRALHQKSEEENQKKVELLINNKHRNSSLIVKPINDQVGKGVFLKENSFFREDDFVALYTGQYQASTEDLLPYSIDLSPHPIFSPNFSSPCEGIINAQNFGNISRYFNDLPENEDLNEYYSINPEIKDSIATANLDLITGNYRGFPVAYFVATKNITSGQVGFSYGRTYWAKAECQLGIKRSLFYKNGSSVEEKNYQCKFLNLQFLLGTKKIITCTAIKILDIKSFLLKKTRIEIMFQKNDKDVYNLTKKELLSSLSKKIHNLDLKEEDIYKCHFYYSIYFILENFLVTNAYSKDPFVQQKVNYVKILKDAISTIKCDDADVAYKTIHIIFNDKNYIEFYKTHLKELRSETIQAMTTYNNEKKEALNKTSYQPPTVSINKFN